MKETSKSIACGWRNDIIGRGFGLDIGAGNDCLPGALAWDKPQGDAQQLPFVPAKIFDFVYSSHCLEHMTDPHRAIRRWFEVVRPGGKLYVVVPTWEHYEKKHWPSKFSGDHRWAFSTNPPTPRLPHIINPRYLLVDESQATLEICELELAANTVDPNRDDTRHGGLCQLKLVWRKEL